MRRETWFPAELSSDIPCITMKGRHSVYIEQHQGLIAYQDDEIIFRTGAGRLCIQGKELCFRQYAASEAVISGNITGILMEGGSP